MGEKNSLLPEQSRDNQENAVHYEPSSTMPYRTHNITLIDYSSGASCTG